MYRIGVLMIWLMCSMAAAQHEHHAPPSKVEPPRVFLDKSPRVVEYQLNRLSSEQLLAIETSTEDPKFVPVFRAILRREGMPRGPREQALRDLIVANQSTAVAELASAIQAVSGEDQAASRTIQSLADLLLDQPPQELEAGANQLRSLAQSGSGLTAQVGFASLLAVQPAERVWQLAEDTGRLPVLLDSLAWVPSSQVRGELHARVAAMLDDDAEAVQAAATRALAVIPTHQDETFRILSKAVRQDKLFPFAVKTLLSVPASQRDPQLSFGLIEFLVSLARKTDMERRTEEPFLDAMQLVEELLAATHDPRVEEYRRQLRETVVRVIRIRTIAEEMRYDTPFFAVEAGRPVQIVLINDDLMPHNLVITAAGALKKVAEAGAEVGPEGGWNGKQYVPQSDDVLQATHMVPAFSQQKLTFEAPTEPGEYPYVCTFPRHWMRMYGVMVVVQDLDAWLRNPKQPADPIGSNRSFVQAWQVQDLAGELEQGLQARSPAIGEQIFTEATCAQCHKMGAYGVGQVGPELSTTFSRFRDDPAAVLQEILDPSHRIEEKYLVHLILDVGGNAHTGLLLKDEQDRITLLDNPEAESPRVILKKNIEQMAKTSNSMMPKGLMDRFSKDEIFELLSFIRNQQQPGTGSSP